MTIHATKLHRPRPRPNWIARPRLLTHLQRSLAEGSRLILVSAPAGSGKTTLLAGWLADHPWRSAWLSLDAEDDEPARFWRCVIGALQSAAPGLGQWALEALNAPAPPPLASLLPDLLNEIGEQAEPLILVLDDYHLMAAPGIHASLADVLDHLPDALHMVICTRADPPLPLARWRGRGELAEIRAADLRFTPEEALAFLNGRMALALGAEEVRQLVERTEGWAVGLQLAALSLQGRADQAAAIRSFAGSRQYMLDYLLEEVLARQPQAVQHFLLCTSILNRLCGPLCDAVTGAEGGAGTLLQLQRQNLFVVPLDEERTWFRYHHLFAELLRARAQQAALQQTAPEQINRLHTLASDWFEHNGMPVDAVRHALAAGDWDGAARLLEAHEQDWWTGSDVAVMNLLPELPDEVVLRGPNLSVYKAWFLLIRGRLADAAALLRAVETSLRSAAATEEGRSLLSFVTMQQAYIAEISGSAPGPAVDVESLAHIPEGRGAMRNSAEVILAYVLYREGNFAEAERLLLATIARDERTGATNGIPISASRLARMWLAVGRLQEAAQLCRRCLATVEERGKWRYFVGGNLSIVLGDILREWNRLEEAEASVRRGIADNEPWQIAHAYALGQTTLARVLLARGDLAGAAAALARQEELTHGRTVPPDLLAETRAVRLRLWLSNGDLSSAKQWAEEWTEEWTDLASAEANFRQEQDLLTLARAWVALGQTQQAVALLARVKISAAEDGRLRRLSEALLLTALGWQAEGQNQRAAQTVEQALAVAAPLGCVHLFVGEPHALDLVAAVANNRMVTAEVQAFARTVLAAAASRHSSTATASSSLPSAAKQFPSSGEPAPLIEALTAREQEVLALLAAGCSNQEIAAKLVVTLHAVKKHTGNIYGKLGVASRTQAIARARELHLLA